MSLCEPGLPEDVWQRVMHHVPLPERLRVCALVSKALYRAAAAATQQLTVHLGSLSSKQTESFWQWLDQHGQSIRVLVVPGHSQPNSQGCRVLTATAAEPVLSRLSCQNLCQLELSRCAVQLGPHPSSSHPGVLTACTALTQLVLNDCTLLGGHSSLAALSGVPALCHLKLCNLRHGQMVHLKGPCKSCFDLPAAVLSCLQQLTCLEVLSTDVCLRHLSCQQKLQHVKLSLLPTAVAITPTNTPNLGQLTSLQDLQLCCVAVDPAALHGCTTLRRLSLESVRAVSSTADREPQSWLPFIAQQQQLQQLRLYSLEGYHWPQEASAYTALSASSNLQQLKLRHITCTNTTRVPGLPAGVWQHGVFRPGRQLPALQRFEFDMYVTAPALFNQQDVTALVSCCPALRVIVLHTHPSVQLTSLAQLTELEDLSLIHADATTCGSLSALSDIRSFHTLKVSGYKLSRSALLPLTSLRPLTALSVAGGVGPMRLCNKGPASESDVWEQLAQRCQPTVVEQQQAAAAAAAAVAVSSQLSLVSTTDTQALEVDGKQ